MILFRCTTYNPTNIEGDYIREQYVLLDWRLLKPNDNNDETHQVVDYAGARRESTA